SSFPIVRPANAKNVQLEDWSTYVDPSRRGVTIKTVLPKCPRRMIRLDDPKNYECHITLSDNTVLLGRPDLMVIDGSSGRRVEFESAEAIDQMIEEARAGGHELSFTCKSRDTFRRPFLMWAN